MTTKNPWQNESLSIPEEIMAIRAFESNEEPITSQGPRCPQESSYKFETRRSKKRKPYWKSTIGPSGWTTHGKKWNETRTCPKRLVVRFRSITIDTKTFRIYTDNKTDLQSFNMVLTPDITHDDTVISIASKHKVCKTLVIVTKMAWHDKTNTTQIN